MKYLIHAANLKVGGGVTVVMNFLKVLIEHNEFHRNNYVVLAPHGVGYEEYNLGTVEIILVPDFVSNPLKRLWQDYTWLNSEINRIKPDVIFTMGNFAVPSSFLQGVLFMYPYAIYPEEKMVWNLFSFGKRLDIRLRNIVFKNRLKYANVIFPQTDTAERRLLHYYSNQISNIKVIPTAYSKLDDNNTELVFFKRDIDKKYLLTLSKYYNHKNLEILIEVAKVIYRDNLPFRIILTLDKNESAGAKKLLDSINDLNLEHIIINIGHINIKSVPALYNQSDGLLLPTLLESFSATYIDSLMMRKPIFTSDRDFARDVCGNVAYYFNPLDANSICNVISNAFSDNVVLNAKVEEGYKRALDFPNWYQVAKMYISELEKLAKK